MNTKKRSTRVWAGTAIIVVIVVVVIGIMFNRADNPTRDVVEQNPTDGSTPEVNEQGNVEKTLGEEASLYDNDGNVVFEINVTDLEYSQTCPSRISDEALKPENGTFLFLTVNAVLSEEVPPELELADNEKFVPLMPENFRLHSADGTDMEDFATLTAYECFDDAELLPSFVSAGEEASGLLVMDVAEEVGTVTYLLNDDPGWSWSVSQTQTN